jgi:hypothetical protein
MNFIWLATVTPIRSRTSLVSNFLPFPKRLTSEVPSFVLGNQIYLFFLTSSSCFNSHTNLIVSSYPAMLHSYIQISCYSSSYQQQVKEFLNYLWNPMLLTKLNSWIMKQVSSQLSKGLFSNKVFELLEESSTRKGCP